MRPTVRQRCPVTDRSTWRRDASRDSTARPATAPTCRRDISATSRAAISRSAALDCMHDAIGRGIAETVLHGLRVDQLQKERDDAHRACAKAAGGGVPPIRPALAPKIVSRLPHGFYRADEPRSAAVTPSTDLKRPSARSIVCTADVNHAHRSEGKRHILFETRVKCRARTASTLPTSRSGAR
jgi:hypothetical protein